MKKILICFFSINCLWAQVDPKNIEIVRDSYGVPHIFAPTDAEVAYGFAWAHAEDDFFTIQQAYLAGNSLLTKHLGNKGLGADFLSIFIGSESLVQQQYAEQIHPAYKKVLEGYAAGLNAYAQAHPDEVLVSELFPVTPHKMLRYAQLQLFVSSKGDKWVSAITNNQTKYTFDPQEMRGSNTFGFSRSKTAGEGTFLAINTHQPLDGPVSWYEAHLCSEEGTNILGAAFAGSPNILIGANEHLAWAHTVNQPDKTDVFALQMHPKNKLQYKVDDRYLTLEKKSAQLRLKVLGIPVQIKKKYYQSIYGPTLKNKNGFFAVRTPALFEIRALEQWWRMNKARNFSEFYKALEMKAIPGYNIGYADKNDTIFYISNGLIPKRNPDYDWAGVVPGNTKKTLWTTTYEVSELPQVLQPQAGYFYNTNHSPFLSTDTSENPDPKDYASNMGFEDYDNNRSTRLKALIDEQEQVSYEDFKRIKYDNSYPKDFHFSWMNIDALNSIEASKYPDIAPLIERIQQWDRKTDATSLGAGAFGILYYRLSNYYSDLPKGKIFPAATLIKALRDTKDYMLKYFGTTEVRLGDFQKLVRGSKELPIFGLPDVLTAMSAKPHTKGKVKVTSGESYIELVRFDDQGVHIESVISYGSSDHATSKHFDDQMELYAQFKTKPMTLDKEKVYEQAVRVYHPME